MDIEIRRAQPEDLPAIVELADLVFGRTGGQMGREFPVLFSPANADKLVVACVNGRPVSHFGVLPFTMRLDGVGVPVACVGSVCTHPDFRGRGLAWKCMDVAVADAVKRGDVLMPISGGLSIYRKHHAHPVGPWKRLLVPRADLPAGSGRPYIEADLEKILARHEALPVRYRWNRELFPTLLKAMCDFGGALWVREDSAGGLAAWALLRSGPPMIKDGAAAVLLEWAGPPELVAELCAAAMDAAGCAKLRLRCPWFADDLIRFLTPLSEDTSAGRSGGFTVKTLNLPKLIELFGSRLRPLKAEANETTLKLSLPSGAVESSKPEVIHNLLFVGAEAWPKEIPVSKETAAELRPFLPLPIPDYGLCYT